MKNRLGNRVYKCYISIVPLHHYKNSDIPSSTQLRSLGHHIAFRGCLFVVVITFRSLCGGRSCLWKRCVCWSYVSLHLHVEVRQVLFQLVEVFVLKEVFVDGTSDSTHSWKRISERRSLKWQVHKSQLIVNLQRSKVTVEM